MGVQPFLIPASLNIIIAQRLVKRVCDDCKQVRPLSEIDKTTLQNIKHALSVTPKEELLSRVGAEKMKAPVFYKAVGCDTCSGN